MKVVRPHWPLWLRRTLLAGAVALMASIAAMVAIGLTGPGTAQYTYWREMLISAPIVTFLGAIILAHRSKHPIGLVMLVSGLANAVALLGGTASVASAVFGWPLVEAGAWLANLLREPAFVVAFALLFQLYPTGEPLGRPGRWMVGSVIGGVAVSVVARALLPGPLLDFPSTPNPLGVAPLGAAMDLFLTVSNIIFVVVGLAGGLATIAIRLVRASGVERLQIRTFFYAVVLAIVGLTAAGAVVPESMEGDIGSVVWTVFPMLVVAAMALAIVRYRLYDVDRLISRTISYGVLTALLVGLYFGLIFLIGSVTPFVGGLPVAASTLAMAALFNPLRRRVQAVVDRRFNRAPYDAATTVEAFSRRLRSEVELTDVVDALGTTTSTTVQPEWLSIWLRPGR